MKRKGFTLVELITVIAIIGVLIIIAVPIYNNMSGNTQEKAYENKIKLVELAAANYAEDFKNELKVNTEKVCVSINTLIKEEFLTSDGKNELYLTNPNLNGIETTEYLMGSVELRYEKDEIVAKYDLAGNCGVHIEKQVAAGDKYEIDITPPTGSMRIIEGDFTNNTRIHLELTLPDADAAYFCYSYTNTEECLIYKNIKDYNIKKIEYNLANNNDGVHHVFLWLKDKYGNVSNPLSDSILYDKVKPTGTITINNGNRYTNNPNVNLKFTYTDQQPASGVYEMCVSNSATCPENGWESDKETRSWTLESIEGDRTVTVWFKDRAGNISIPYTAVIMLDTIKPTNLSVFINGNAPYTNKAAVTLTIDSFDATSGVEKMCVSETPTCPDTNWIDYATTHSLTLSGDDGQKFVYVKFRDNALNESNTINDTIILDTINPVVTFSPAPGTYTKPQTVKVTITELNYNKMDVQVNNAVGKVDALSKNGITTKEYSVYLDRHTEWTVYAKSTDLAGNKQTTIPLNSYDWTYAVYKLNLEYTLTYNNNTGNGCTNKKIIHNELYGSLCSSKKAGYGFSSWNTLANGTGTTITENTTVKVVDNQTIYAQFTICKAGTYNDGTSSSCMTCPNGYTSNAGATSITSCYMTVADGKYIKNANDSAGTNCLASTYKTEHTVNYGQTSTCTSCAKGEFSAAGARVCDLCPSGYQDGAAVGLRSDCIKSVPAANRVASAGGGATSCGTGYYKAKHDVKYGQTSTCDQCDAGYRDGAAVGLRSDCIKSVPAANRVASAGGGATSCGTGYYKAKHDVKYGQTSTCDQCDAGYRDGAAVGLRSDCIKSVPAANRVASAGGGATSCGTGYYKAKHDVKYGQTSTCDQCDAGYRDGAAVGLRSDCIKSVPAANRVASAGGGATGCGTGYYKAKHDVKYGQTSTCDQCDAGYRDGAAVGLRSDCIKSVPAANRVASAGGSATSCGTGYYKAKHDVKYGQTSTCDQCDAGYRDGAAVGLRSDCIKSVPAANRVASAGGGATSCGTGYYKAKHDVKYGQTSTCDQCDAGYRDGAAVGLRSDCIKSVPAANRVASAGGGATSCGTGYYKAKHDVKYGQTSTCSQCDAGYRDGAAVGLRSDCIKSVPAANRVASAGGGATSCGTGYYKAKHDVKYGQTSTCSQCDAGYRDGAAVGLRSDCIKSVPAANRVASAGGGATSCGTGYYKAKHDVKYGQTSTCSQCDAGYRDGAAVGLRSDCIKSVPAANRVASAGGGATSCGTGYYKAKHDVKYGQTSTCDQCDAGYRDGAAVGLRSDCIKSVPAANRVASAGGGATSCGTGYYKAKHDVKYGQTSTCDQCDAGYRDGAAVGLRSDCIKSVPAANRVASAGGGATSCGTGYYKAKHDVKYGQTSTCDQCDAGYRDGAAVGLRSDCIKSVPAANRVASAGGGATSCGTGYYKAKHDVKYGQTSTCSQCDAGYRDGAAVGLRSDCIKSVPAANRVASAGGGATSCGTGYYKAKHDVKYGQTSTCDQCDAGYRDGAAVGLRSDCIKSVSAGNKVASVGGSATSCGTGYYKAKHDVKYGQTSSCDLCPTNFTSDAGSGAITNCYFTVTAGHYKNSLYAKSEAVCEKGKYNGSHRGYYGTNTSCTDCVSGYRDGDGTTAQSECIMNVPGGNYVSAPYASSSILCGANTYKPSHTVKYGGKSDCVACESGYTSPAGSASSSACVAACTKYWEKNGTTTYRTESSHCSGVPTSLPSVNDYNEGDTISVCTSYKYYICASWYQDPKPSGCGSRYYESCSSCGGLGDSLGARAAKTPYILKCE